VRVTQRCCSQREMYGRLDVIGFSMSYPILSNFKKHTQVQPAKTESSHILIN
jgi:hypothetical protein